MGTTLNRTAYQRLIDEDLAWLEKQPHSLEREHIEDIVRLSPSREYANATTTLPDFTEHETGWLIEKMAGGQIWYVTVDQLLTWTTDSLKALRLARREDADMLCEIIEDAEKVAEHQWG